MSDRHASSGAQLWHAQTVAEVLRTLESSPQGLATDTAAQRLAAHGPNRLPQGRRRNVFMRFALQFHNLLIYVLVAAAGASIVLGHLVDAAVIFAVVLANALIGFIQEGRAEHALEAIRSMIDPSASVLRDGRRTTLAAHALVPGDVVLLEAGDRVPADLRLLQSRNLSVDEAILTGESVAVEKDPAPVAAEAALGDRTALAFSGTFVTAGQGTGVVVVTGAATELGRISTLLGAVEQLQTPLLRQMDQFAGQLTVVVLGIAMLAFGFAVVVREYPLTEAFMAVVGLAVAAIPEGLPAILTITLAIGVRRMAARQAIVRRLPAVETLGAVSVICSDKTGTLTRNEMTARTLLTPDAEYAVTGVGYAPEGAVEDADGALEVPRHAHLGELVRAAALCNDAEVRQVDGAWTVDGDPMEGALVVLARKAGLEPARLRAAAARIDVLPFDARHRFMATLHHGPAEAAFILIKGAPERVFEMCAQAGGSDGAGAFDSAAWHAAAAALASRGQRVLAFASKPARRAQRRLTVADVERGAVLLGCIGFIDPPRPEAIEAVAECRRAGIRVVMITGDHAATAREIARQLGLDSAPAVCTGQELDALDDVRLAAIVQHTAVFARTTPEHKLRLVRALQDAGLTVAMTGDGVNDAPALKRADVGVAMGRKGTEVAKEAAEMVLADDNFASIVAAVREGRTVYDNLLKVIGWTLPTNGGEALTILSALALGLALPVTPVQILWINMVTAVALGLTLAFEPTEPAAMQRAPRRRSQPILTGELIWRIGFVSVLFVAGAFGMYFWAVHRALPVPEARTLVVNTLVVMEVFYLFSVRYVHGPALTWAGALGTPAVLIGVGATVAAQLAFTYTPWLQAVFDTRAVRLADGVLVIGVGVGLLIVVEIEKRLRMSFASRHQRAGDGAGAASGTH